MKIGRIGVYAVLLCLLAFAVLPLLFMVTASSMSSREIMRMPYPWIPSSFRYENFAKAIRGNDGDYMYPRNILNSLIAASAVAASTVLLASSAGYGLAKFKFRGRTALFMMIMATMMIPFEAIMIPLYMVAMKLHIQNTHIGLILPFMVSAFGVFQVRQYLTTFPAEFLDAARVDGMGEFGIFWRIVFPNCKPVIATLAVIAFRGQWDNLLWPLLVSQSDRMKTIPQYISTFIQDRSTDQGALMAAALIASIPMLAMFMALTKYFIGGSAIYESRKG